MVGIQPFFYTKCLKKDIYSRRIDTSELFLFKKVSSA